MEEGEAPPLRTLSPDIIWDRGLWNLSGVTPNSGCCRHGLVWLCRYCPHKDFKEGNYLQMVLAGRVFDVQKQEEENKVQVP